MCIELVFNIFFLFSLVWDVTQVFPIKIAYYYVRKLIEKIRYVLLYF